MLLDLYKKKISFKEFVLSFYNIEDILGNLNQYDIKKFNVLLETLEKISEDFNRLLLGK